MKRAGLDYWDQVKVEVVDELPLGKFFFFSSKATKSYASAEYPEDAYLIFGSETSGLPSHYWEQYPEQFYTIPMAPGPRCLNLATSAAIVLYEALRQNAFTFCSKT